MVRVKVPATSANIGAGFDCLGIALDLYNIIEVEEIESGLEIIVPPADREFIEQDERNLVFVAMQRLFDEVGYKPKGLRINLVNNIPITRGLGSSAACIAGGLLAANALIRNPLSKNDIIYIAAKMDGHPDNVLPALVGGMTVACIVEGEVKYVRIDLPDHIKLLVMVPDFQLPTVKARSILPDKVSMQDAVFNISRAALLTASVLTGCFDNLPTAIDDRLHQPYRKNLIPHWDEIMEKTKELGTRGAFLSGAGPTLIAIVDKNYDIIKRNMAEFLSAFEQHWDVYIMDICRYGAELITAGEGEIACH